MALSDSKGIFIGRDKPAAYEGKKSLRTGRAGERELRGQAMNDVLSSSQETA